MGKWDKNFITEPKPGDTHHIDKANAIFPIYVDHEVVEGAHYFMAASHLSTTGKGTPPIEHSHDYDEYLVFLGSNQKDPRDLGGEIEFWMDGEKYMITKSCAVFIPAGVKHAPIYFKRIDTPIWYIATSPTKIYEVPPEVQKTLPPQQAAK